jgi:hypothetical protein
VSGNAASDGELKTSDATLVDAVAEVVIPICFGNASCELQGVLYSAKKKRTEERESGPPEG